MRDRGQANPEALVGALVTVLTTTLIALVGLAILSPLAKQCPTSGELASACTSVTNMSASALANSVGVLPIVIVILAILGGIASRSR